MKVRIQLSTILLLLLIILSITQIVLLHQLSVQLLTIAIQQPNHNPENIQISNWKNDCGKPLEGYDGLFVYMTTCPFSNRMKPLVEKSNLKWYWVDVRDPKCKNINLSKFNYSGYVPFFYCFKTGSYHVGAMPEEQFINWTKTNC